MYEYISGSLVEITPTDAIVEAYGVGYDASQFIYNQF